MLTIMFKGEEKELSTKLKVAYLAQGAFNHKPYMEIFQSMGDMSLDEHLTLVYVALKAGNKGMEVSLEEFIDDFTDNYDITELMNILTKLINGIMGVPDEPVEKVELELVVPEDVKEIKN